MGKRPEIHLYLLFQHLSNDVIKAYADDVYERYFYNFGVFLSKYAPIYCLPTHAVDSLQVIFSASKKQAMKKFQKTSMQQFI